MKYGELSFALNFALKLIGDHNPWCGHTEDLHLLIFPLKDSNPAYTNDVLLSTPLEDQEKLVTMTMVSQLISDHPSQPLATEWNQWDVGNYNTVRKCWIKRTRILVRSNTARLKDPKQDEKQQQQRHHDDHKYLHQHHHHRNQRNLNHDHLQEHDGGLEKERSRQRQGLIFAVKGCICM